MRILNFGSLNIDHVYRVERYAAPGETVTCQSYDVGCGGKGLNQSVALAMAGAEVYHAGVLGKDGGMLRTKLADSGVDCSYLTTGKTCSGHAVIFVNAQGQNSIVLCPGSNHALTESLIDSVLDRFEPGDILLLQNETNHIPYLMRKAAQKGLQIAFNAAPITPRTAEYPLELVRWLIVNETEGAALAGTDDPEQIAQILCRRYPGIELILTLGTDGSLYQKGELSLYFPARRVRAVDTTAAGDTFTGYFLSAISDRADAAYAMTLATTAAALCVTKPGAADSIPALEDVLKAM